MRVQETLLNKIPNFSVVISRIYSNIHYTELYQNNFLLIFKTFLHRTTLQVRLLILWVKMSCIFYSVDVHVTVKITYIILIGQSGKEGRRKKVYVLIGCAWFKEPNTSVSK